MWTTPETRRVRRKSACAKRRLRRRRWEIRSPRERRAEEAAVVRRWRLWRDSVRWEGEEVCFRRRPRYWRALRETRLREGQWNCWEGGGRGGDLHFEEVVDFYADVGVAILPEEVVVDAGDGFAV